MVKKKATLHRLMDADKNDQITLNEFMRGLAMSGIRPVPSDEQLMTLFESFDADSGPRFRDIPPRINKSSARIAPLHWRASWKAERRSHLGRDGR